MTDKKLTMLMSLLFSGALPHKKNEYGKTFLETSPIRNKLCTKISDSTDLWIQKQWNDKNLRESWFMLKDDEVLITLWKRFKLLGPTEEIFEFHNILSSIAVIWTYKNYLQTFFQDYVATVSKYFSYDLGKIKSSCQKYLDSEVLSLFCDKVHESLNDFQIQDIMDRLMVGELELVKSFCHNTPIRSKLCTRIIESSDEWAINFWKNRNFIEIWILYEGSDELLRSVFKRMGSINQPIGDPISIANRCVFISLV